MNCIGLLPPLDLSLNSIATKTNDKKVLEFTRLRREVAPLLFIVQDGPTSELEGLLCDETDLLEESQENVDSYISQVQELQVELRNKVEEQKTVERDLWEKVLENHEQLENNCCPDLEYCNSRKNLVDTLRKLLHEQELAQERKKVWISKNIFETRKELEEIWKDCMLNDDVTALFPAFTAINFSEELLELHKQELEKWKTYHAKNQVLFDQIKKRSTLWANMIDLHAKSQDPNRFVNRGGALLKSQNEMNYITKTLPKAEEKLVSLVKAFEKENKRKLLVSGKSVEQLIADDWKDFKERTRKRPVEETPSSQKIKEINPQTGRLKRGASTIGLVSASASKRKTIRPMPADIKKMKLEDYYMGLQNTESGKL